MNEYRFHLQKYAAGKNTKQTCPQCGKKRCFVRYVDEEGEIGFPDYVGRCDHEDSCGYHYTLKISSGTTPTQSLTTLRMIHGDMIRRISPSCQSSLSQNPWSRLSYQLT